MVIPKFNDSISHTDRITTLCDLTKKTTSYSDLKEIQEVIEYYVNISKQVKNLIEE